MKPYVITILFLILTTALMAQKPVTDPLYDVDKIVVIDSSYALSNSLEDQLIYTRYNLKRYHKARQTAYGVAATGVVFGAIGLAAVQQESDYGKYFGYAGAACTVVSAFIFYDAEKWLKKASVRIDLTGVRITF